MKFPACLWNSKVEARRHVRTMNWYSEEDKLLRRYLLDDLTAEERRSVEDRLLSSDESTASVDEDEPDFVDRLLLAEDELIDDYALEALSVRELELFEKNFYPKFENHVKLVTAKEIVIYAANSEAEPDELERLATLTLASARSSEQVVEKDAESAQIRPKLDTRTQVLGGFFISIWKIPLYAALVLGLAIIGWRLLRGESDIDKGMALLSQVCREQRPLGTRITVLACNPSPITRGDEAASERQDLPELDEAAALLHKAAREKADSESLHALGRLYLVKGEFSKARAQLEQALKLTPNDPRLHADLGMVLLEKNKPNLNVKREPSEVAVELGNSLDELDKAIELDRNLTEAYFNRALCRQLMGLNKLAGQGWKEYLEKDSSSLWATEARRYLKLLEEEVERGAVFRKQLFDRFLEAWQASDEEKAWEVFKTARSRAGNVITNRLLVDWMENVQKNLPQDAEKLLQILSWIGQIESRRVGDFYTADLASYYEKVGKYRPARLALAREAFVIGLGHYDRQDFTTAAAAFTRAGVLFQKAGDIYEASFAGSWVGYCQTRLELVDSSLAQFSKLTRFYRKRSYKNLLAYALHSMADAYTSRDEWSASTDLAKEASEMFGDVEDKLGDLRAKNTLASVNWMLGRYEDAMSTGIEAISMSGQLTADLKQIYGFYTSTVRNLMSLGYQYAARDVQQEAYYLAVQSGWPGLKSSSYAGLGMSSSILGRHDDAVNYAELALQEAASLTDEQARNNQLAIALFYQGHFLRRLGKHREAVICYKKAIALYEKNEFRFFVYKAYEGCFLALMTLGENHEASKTLEKAVSLLEAFRRKIIEEDRRSSFFDTEQEFYDAAIEFEWTRLHRSAEAFNISESSRARSLLDTQRRPAKVLKHGNDISLQMRYTSQPLGLEEIQDKLPEKVKVVHYAVLPDKVITWVIGRKLFDGKAVKIAGTALERKITRFITLLSGDVTVSSKSNEGQDRKILAEELYDVLIHPVKHLLSDAHLICFVPDKELNLLPFAALSSRETGQYFIEEHSFVVSPSSTTFIFSYESAQARKSLSGEKLLLVGDPQLNLSAVKREVRILATLYPNHSSILIGAEAKESAFRREAQTSDIIHIASHALANERSPLLSKLLFAPDTTEPAEDEGHDGALHAYELYELGSFRAQLVVLAACQTGSGKFWRGEGVMSLARPFLRAGVPTVIVSLWNVDSERTADLMTKFHEFRKTYNLPVAEALREAQLDLLRRTPQLDERGLTWAAFVATGSSSLSKIEQVKEEKGKSYARTR